MPYYRLDECTLIVDCPHSTAKDEGNGYPLIRTPNIGRGRLILDGVHRVSYETYCRRNERATPQKNDLILAREASVGNVAIIKEGQSVCLGQRTVLIRPNIDIVDPNYLVYYLLSPKMQQILLNSSNGATVSHLNISDIRKLEIELPNIKLQRKIGQLLAIVDDKIAINDEINDNLAEQAQGVLCHFMDEHPYQLQPLSDIAIVIDCLHSKKPSAVEDSAYQLIQLDNIRDDGFLDMSATRYMISQADYENWTRKCEIVEGDCVITNVGRIGAVSQAPYGTKAAMGRNMTCIRLKPEIKLQAYFITVLLSNHMRRQIQSNTDEGTIMGALNVKNIPKLLFPVFEPSVMTELEDILFPLRKQIEYNNLQNQNLSQLRDTLLPKLMSGEIDVSDIAI